MAGEIVLRFGEPFTAERAELAEFDST